MRRLKLFESFKDDILIIVDVQKSFKKYFNEMYLYEVKKYCSNFREVYQIFDNHVDGVKMNKNYLYHENPERETSEQLYEFPNQVELIEKRYQYDVNIDFYKSILDTKTLNYIREMERSKTLKVGDLFTTKMGNAIVFIGNNHVWFEIPKKLYQLFKKLEGKEVTLIGGSMSECLADVEISAKSLGVIVKKNYLYIYSASHCPIDRKI
jgi:hypothetical protein